MAFADTTLDASGEALDSLSLQIGKFLSGTPDRESIKKVGLGASFAIWQLDPKDFNSKSPTLPSAPTEFWHFQVFLNRRPLAYAIVKQAGGKLNVCEVAVSSLAERIDQAIVQVETYDEGDTPVRFFVVPSCLVYAFLLVQTEEFYVIAAPEQPQKVTDEKQFTPGAILPRNEFLDRLRILHSALYRENEYGDRDRKSL
jgi:hypothetical protein